MFAKVNGIRLFFDVVGSGLRPIGSEMVQMPALFVLHGGPGCDHSYFRPWLDPLAEHAQLIYLDHRGNGRSEYPDETTYTIAQMADDVDALRDYLGFDRIMMLGHSFGGMVAQTYALKHQDRLTKLVLAATTPSSQFWDEAQDVAQVRATDEQLEVLNALFEGRITTQEEHDAWWRVCMPLYFEKIPDPEMINVELDRMIGAVGVSNYMMKNEIPNFDVRPRLGELRVPTLVLAGRHDWVTPVSQSAAINDGIPGSQLVVMEESAHMGFAEEQEDYLRYLSDFLFD
jgi:proline iminopeptidase